MSAGAGEPNPTGRGAQARRVLRHHREGALSTHSLKLPGYPYASALPYCTDQRGRVVVLISHLAEHTRNAEADGRAGFLVAAFGAGLQEQARVSLLGDIAPTDDPSAIARYLRFHPDAAGLLGIGGFRFFRIEPRAARFIAGFGSIHSVSGDSLLADDLPIARAEDGILEHMNADHARNLRDYCRHCHGVHAEEATMVGVDCDGFDVRADGRLLRFDFDPMVGDATDARARLVALAQASRG
jgi:putative heme iron utilization protein